jgi:zinc protease
VAKPTALINHSLYPTPEGWKHPLSFEREPSKIVYPKAETSKVGGATLFYLPDRELPLIDLTILVKAGEVDVNDDKIGLTKIFNQSLIRGGTENYSPTEFALVLDENAIQLSISAHEEETLIRLSVMRDDWEQGLAMLEEVLVRPEFDASVLQVVKDQQLIALKRQGGDAQAVAWREGTIWHFQGHPYGRDPLQGLETIPTITQDDLKTFIAKYFVPSNMVVAVAGDIDKARVIKGLGQLFAALPKSTAPVRTLKDPPETAPVLALINKPGQVQSQVSLRLPSVKRTDPAYWKMSLLMNVFGGDDSLMYTSLRDNLGLAYSAWFFQTYKWQAGTLIGYIGCKNDKTRLALRETVDIMTALQKNVPKKEVEQKRLDALNSFVFNVDTPTELVEVYGRYQMRQEPLDTLERIQDSYIGATSEELETLAEELLEPSRMQIFIVTDKNTLTKKEDGSEITLEDDMKELAKDLGLPYKEIPLR